MNAEGNGDLPVPDLRTMKELCQPSLNGRGGPIAPIAIQTTNFGLKNDMIQQDTSAQRSESSSSITFSFDTEIAALKAEMEEINKNLIRVLQVNQPVKAVTPSCETCSGPHSFSDCPATVGNTQNVYAAGAYQEVARKLGDTKKFLILCDFPGMAECLALADLDASINLMPLSVWNKLYLHDLSPTCMTLELADHSISHPVGVVEDVFVKVGTFYFSADFVIVDFDVDPRVPLIPGRSFLKTRRALIDVFEGELTLRVGKEAITFNLDLTSRYSTNYNDMTANRIDVIYNTLCFWVIDVVNKFTMYLSYCTRCFKS
nr:reverse transcriptase domain-containing protein [Tanacetum cinerariifolium]